MWKRSDFVIHPCGLGRVEGACVCQQERETEREREREKKAGCEVMCMACGMWHPSWHDSVRHWLWQPVREPDLLTFNISMRFEHFILFVCFKIEISSCLLRFGHLAKAIKYLICYGNCIFYGAIFAQIVFSNSRGKASCLHISMWIRTYVHIYNAHSDHCDPSLSLTWKSKI